MLENIKKALEAQGISVYTITEALNERVELYFIGTGLDMKRQVRVLDDTVTVYRDFEEDGVCWRGSASISLPDGMDEAQIGEKLKQAYFGASFVKNKWYPIPKPQSAEPQASGMDSEKPSETKQAEEAFDWQADGMRLAQAAFEAAKTEEGAFLNSMEIFSRRTAVRIVNSEGIDVSYTKYGIDGELVAQCRTPQDVETYEDFQYDRFDGEAIAQKVKNTLKLTRDRAMAKEAPAAGSYRLILSGKYVATVMSYFMERSHASLIYQHYSNYKVGEDVQAAGSAEEIAGDRLNASLIASVPYSMEGIPMKDRSLLKDGTLQTVHGSSRFCYYLGEEPTGDYKKLAVGCGTMPVEEMKKAPYLYAVNFSDFQMDSLGGNFGGEIRLAYLFDGEKVTCVTGGSVNGSIHAAQKHMRLSQEVQDTTVFAGPYAISIDNVTVAGAKAAE